METHRREGGDRFHALFGEMVRRMGTVAGRPITPDEPPSGFTDFGYITPNEFHGVDYEPCLPKEKGAYIGVGSLRALNIASSGRVSHFVSFDLSRGNRLFALAVFQNAVLSYDRYEFMCRLFLGKKDENLIRIGRNEQMPADKFAQLVIQHAEKGTLVKNWRESGIQMPTADWELMDRGIERAVREGVAKSLVTYREVNRLHTTFFEDETRFQNLRNLALEGKVTVVTGDLTASKAFSQLADSLAKENIPVSALDISNSFTSFPSAQADSNFARDFFKLRFVSGGRLLMTDGVADPIIGRNGKAAESWPWAYYAFTASKLKAMQPTAEKFHLAILQSTRMATTDPAFTNDANVVRTLKDDRCADPVGDLRRAIKKLRERVGLF